MRKKDPEPDKTEQSKEVASSDKREELVWRELLAVARALKNPESGCPWHLMQTPQSLKPFLLEEAGEAGEAIDAGNPEALCDELGDVLLQVILHSLIAAEAGQFDLAGVCAGLEAKLRRRHPHVFGSSAERKVRDLPAIRAKWEAVKALERQGKRP